MAKTSDYNSIVQIAYKEIEKLFKMPKAWAQEDEKILQLFAILKEAVWQQVHSVLVPIKTEKSEKEIRDILAKYVVGYPNKKGINYIGALQPIKAKLVQMKKNKKDKSRKM